MSKNKKERKVSETISEKIVKTTIKTNKAYLLFFIFIIMLLSILIPYSLVYTLFHDYLGGLSIVGMFYINFVLLIYILFNWYIIDKESAILFGFGIYFILSFVFSGMLTIIISTVVNYNDSLANYNIGTLEINEKTKINEIYSELDETKEKKNTVCYYVNLLNNKTNIEERKYLNYCIEKKEFSKETIKQVLKKRKEFVNNLRTK